MKKRINDSLGISEQDWVRKQLKNPDKLITIGTLFSGIGALEHAFKKLKLKHKIAFAGDIDPHVKNSYFENYSIEEDQWHSDVTEFCAKKYKNKIDLLMGGSPCQSFSMVGKRRGLEDKRGSLIYEFIRVVNECKPKVFIFENVKGLANHEKGATWQSIKEEFESIGYSNLHPMILNAKDYGIPPKSRAFFVIGFKNKRKKMKVPRPILLEKTMQDFLLDHTESKYYLSEKGVKFVTSTKNRIKRYTQINGEIMLCQKANQQTNWHGDFVFEKTDSHIEFNEFIFNVNDVEEKYFLSDKVKDYVLAGGTGNYKTSTKTDLSIARPLLQTMHKMHRAGVDNYVSYPQGKIRKLTPRECLRLMGFRDSFKTVVSDTQMYRQAGNSVVVDVLIAILKEMDITIYGS